MKDAENKNEKPAYIYLIRCEGGSLYTGITTDLERRFAEHVAGSGVGAKYTRSHPAQKTEAAFLAKDLKTAARYEYRIKHLPKEKKELLVKEPERIGELLSEPYGLDPVKVLAKRELPRR